MVYGRHVLPAFDAYAYVAMAERPAFFTVAPWGFRILTPAIVRVLPFRDIARTFRVVTEGALILAGVALFVYLRRLGSGEMPSLLGTAAFTLSSPVGEAVRYRFLVEPVTVLLEILFLWALQAGAAASTLALIAVLGVWSKEAFILFVPLVFLVRQRHGGGRAIVDALMVALPAIGASSLLRPWWAPHFEAPLASFGPAAFALALSRIRDTWPEWWSALLLSGLSLIALAGAFRGAARHLLMPTLFLLGIVLIPPFFNPVAFFPADIPRLLIYVLPAVIPLALVAVDRFWPHFRPLAPTVPHGPGRWMWLAVLAAAVAPFLAVDRYRRIDLRGRRDGPYVLTVCRESIRMARRLAQGQEVRFDPESQQFVWGLSEPSESGHMRWVLREGWGEQAHYGTGQVVMRSPQASLLLPVLTPADLTLDLRVEAPQEMRLALMVNGHPVGEWMAGPVPTVQTFELPRARLFRGDNLLTLSSVDGRPGARLHEAVFRP